MLRRLKRLGATFGTIVLMAGATRAATVSSTTDTVTPDAKPAVTINTDVTQNRIPEPATMMLLGTGLLAIFRARRRLPA